MKPCADVTVTHGRIETAERRRSENTITGVEGSFKGIVVRLSMSILRKIVVLHITVTSENIESFY